MRTKYILRSLICHLQSENAIRPASRQDSDQLPHRQTSRSNRKRPIKIFKRTLDAAVTRVTQLYRFTSYSCDCLGANIPLPPDTYNSQRRTTVTKRASLPYQLGFNAQHSPMGAFMSFTCGNFGTRGGIGLQIGQPGDQEVFIGFKEGDRYSDATLKCLPFYTAAVNRSADAFLVEQAGPFP